MPTLSVTKTYQDGDILAEADLDNIRDSIETFINSTKLDNDNIQTNGIDQTKINIIDDFYLEFGTGNDGAIGVSSDHLNIKNVTLDKDILFKVNDGGVVTTPLQITCATSITTISSLKATGTIDANTNLISNVVNPVSAQDADTKAAREAAITAKVPTSQVVASGYSGTGSTNTKIKIFTANTVTGSGITYATSATAGDSFTIAAAGVYAISYTDGSGTNNGGGGNGFVGLSLNSNQLTTDIEQITTANRLAASAFFGAFDAAFVNHQTNVAWTGRLAVNDVIRAHIAGTLTADNPVFTITQVAIL